MLQKLLESKRLYTVLLILNVVTILALFMLTRHETGPDAATYLGLVDGIMHGRYSFWWFLPVYQPDTLRNPGFPVFLTIVRLFTQSLMAVRIIQLCLYFIAIYFILRITDHYTKRQLTKNILLIFLFLSINVSVYVTLIYPEMLALFLLVSSVYAELILDDRRWYKYLILGLIYGCLFEIRPALLFIPFIKLAYDWVYRRQHPIYPAYKLLTLAIMFLIMLPYGFWNKKNHGVFSVTSLEGGGGLMHSGQWSYKVPNYTEHRYWGVMLPDELVSEKDTNKVKENIIAYNKEWDYIDSVCRPYLTTGDSIMLAHRTGQNRDQWLSYNAKYTMTREKLLKQLTIKHYLAEPLYTLKVRTYTFFRLWYSGLFSNNKSSPIRFKNITFVSPFFVASLLSFIIFLFGVIFIPIACIKNFKAMKVFAYPIILLLYFGFIHSPFAVQARYTTPVKLIFIMVIAQALTVIFFPVSKEKEEAESRSAN